MKKRIMSIILAMFILVAAFGLASCSKKEEEKPQLSGKYVNTKNSQDYYDFTSEKELIVYELGLSVAGEYRIEDDILYIKAMLFGTEAIKEYTLSEDGNSFTNESGAWVKEGASAQNPEKVENYPIINLTLKTYNSTFCPGEQFSNQITYISPDGQLFYKDGIYDNVRSVASNNNNTFFIKNDNTLWALGNYNSRGSLGDDTGLSQTEPKQILDNVENFYTSNYATCFAVKSDKTLWGWGANDDGKLPTGNSDDVYAPKQILDNVVKVYPLAHGCMAIQADGSLFVWGNFRDEFESEYAKSHVYDEPTKIFGGVTDVFYLGYTNGTFGIITEKNKLYIWGTNTAEIKKYFNTGDAKFLETPVAVLEDRNISYITSSYYGGFNGGSCDKFWFVDTDNTLWGIGRGGLGDGTAIERTQPVEILKDVIYMPYAEYFVGNCAVTKDGSVYFWDNSRTDRVSPEKLFYNAAMVGVNFVDQEGNVYLKNGDDFAAVPDVRVMLPNCFYVND